MFEWAVLVFDKARMFIFLKRGHCDIVWYVESYKRLVLNSICKINSPGQERFVLFFLPHFLGFLPLFFSLESQSSNSLNQTFLFLCNKEYNNMHNPYPLLYIWVVLVKWVEVNVVARGPAGGHRSLGTGSVWEVIGQEWWVQLAPSSGNVSVCECLMCYSAANWECGLTSSVSVPCHSVPAEPPRPYKALMPISFDHNTVQYNITQYNDYFIIFHKLSKTTLFLALCIFQVIQWV